LTRRAGWIYSNIKSFLITHSHLDHIFSLVLTAGSLSNLPKSVYSIESTQKYLDKVFRGGIWPRLADSTGKLPLWMRTIKTGSRHSSIPILPSISARAFKLFHGTDSKMGKRSLDESSDFSGSIYSTAFFLTENQSKNQFLFFGDLGPDSLSPEREQKLNLAVWKHASRLFNDGKMKTIFIECSYPSSRPPELLYGHLSPIYLFEELLCFAKQVTGRDNCEEQSYQGVLDGLNVIIIHIKEEILSSKNQDYDIHPLEIPTCTIKQQILNEILELEINRYQFGCKFLIADQGDRF
ncbi:cyclic-AMP phosphodiesterase, partial [Phakopsora pachyrhizi]